MIDDDLVSTRARNSLQLKTIKVHVALVQSKEQQSKHGVACVRTRHAPRTILHDLTNKYNANPQPYKKKATKGTQVSLSLALLHTRERCTAHVQRSPRALRRRGGPRASSCQFSSGPSHPRSYSGRRPAAAWTTCGGHAFFCCCQI